MISAPLILLFGVHSQVRHCYKKAISKELFGVLGEEMSPINPINKWLLKPRQVEGNYSVVPGALLFPEVGGRLTMFQMLF